MKYFLLFLFVLLSLPAVAQEQHWEVPAFEYRFERVPEMGSTANYQWNVSGGTWYGGTGAAFNAGTGGGVRTGTRPAATARTDLNTTSLRLTIVVLMGGSYVPVWWQQARKVGETTPPKGGPYDSGGNPTTPEGEPVNEKGDPVEAPKRYYCENTYTNTTGLPVVLMVEWYKNEDGSVIKNYSKNCEAGSAYKSFGYYHKPFSISIQASVDGIPIGDIKTEPSVPVDDGDPNHPEKPDPGEPGGEGGPASGGGQSIPGTGQVPTPDPVTPEPRPGEGDPNDEARHKELMAQIGRVVKQVGSAANQAAQDADRSNELLGDIAGNTEGIGEGGNGNTDGGDFQGPAGGSTSIGGIDSAVGGIGTKISNIRAGAGELLDASGQLLSSVGLSPNQGSVALAWDVPLGPFGSVRWDMDSVLGQYIPLMRSLMAFFLGIWFVSAIFDTLKEAF